MKDGGPSFNGSASPVITTGDANAQITRAVRKVYQLGRWVVGTVLSMGIVLYLVGGDVPARRPPHAGLMPAWFSGALLTLWAIPVITLLTAGIGWLRRRPGDAVGWLAVLMVGFLISLWIAR